jgi:hypothetical protein
LASQHAPPLPLLLTIAAALAPVPSRPPTDIACPAATSSRQLLLLGLRRVALITTVVVELEAEDEHGVSLGERRLDSGIGGRGLAGREEPFVEVLGDEDLVAAAEVHLLTTMELPA